jgi:hypothetical protein
VRASLLYKLENLDLELKSGGKMLLASEMTSLKNITRKIIKRITTRNKIGIITKKNMKRIRKNNIKNQSIRKNKRKILKRKLIFNFQKWNQLLLRIASKIKNKS